MFRVGDGPILISRRRWEKADLLSGKRVHNYGKSPFLMGKSTINVPFSIANCVSLPEGFSGFSHRTQWGKCSFIDPA